MIKKFITILGVLFIDIQIFRIFKGVEGIGPWVLMLVISAFILYVGFHSQNTSNVPKVTIRPVVLTLGLVIIGGVTLLLLASENWYDGRESTNMIIVGGAIVATIILILCSLKRSPAKTENSSNSK